MPSFYMFSEEQLRKLKINDLLKLANYYHVPYTKSKPNADKIIQDVLEAQSHHNDNNYVSAGDAEPPGASARILRIRASNRKE